MTVVALKNTTTPDAKTGRDVLLKEAAALTTLAENLDGAFSEAVALMLGIRGRVAVTGMGKSGHVGAKIAATLASTGTPAFFVHPGEASHGDLGMVTADDVVLAIGHSGESRELGDVLAYCQRFGVPVIAITGRENSTLGRAATVVLNDRVAEEACPLNLAPTSSSTAAMGLGDALAVALMHRRDFKPEDFARYHPGGKLGSRLLKVADIMVTGEHIPLVGETATMDGAILEMTAKNLGGVGIVNAEGILLGIVTDGDLKRHMGENLLTRPVTEIMTRAPKTVSAESFASAAVRLMQESKITTLFVLEGQKPVGVLRILDCLQAGVI